MLICEWDIESYISRISVPSQTKLHTLSFLRGGYITSNGMVGGLFRIFTNYVVGYDVWISAIEDDFYTSIASVEYDPRPDRPDGNIRPVDFDDRFREIVSEFVIDELGRRYEQVIDDIILVLSLVLAMMESQFPYQREDVEVWGSASVYMRLKKHQALEVTYG